MRKEGPLIIGIAGGTGSGKTSLAEAVLQQYQGSKVMISHDSYYYPQDHLPSEVRAQKNYDHPDSLETELLISHLQKLMRGQSIDQPTYDFSQHTRSNETIAIDPVDLIIVEGILCLSSKELCDLLVLRIFVTARADTRLARRVLRDTMERGRTTPSVIEQYLTTVRPMHDEFVEPAKAQAHTVIDGEGDVQKEAEELVKLISSPEDLARYLETRNEQLARHL